MIGIMSWGDFMYYGIRDFDECNSFNDIIEAIKQMNHEQVFEISDIKNNYFLTDKEIDYEILDSSYKFLESINKDPWLLSIKLGRKNIDLSPKNFETAVNHLIIKNILEIENKSENIEIIQAIDDKFEEAVNATDSLMNFEENEIDDRKYVFRGKLYVMVNTYLAIIDISKYQMTPSGISYYHNLKNEKVLDQIKELKNQIELQEGKVQSNLINISGLMIALFSIIGFNIYSINKTLSVPAILMMNESILLAISVMFYLIELIVMKKGETSKVLPVVIWMVILILGTMIAYNLREFIPGVV